MKTYPENSFCANIKLKHKGERERRRKKRMDREEKKICYIEYVCENPFG